MDQIMVAIIFILSLGAGIAALLEPIVRIVLVIIRYLKYLFSGPFKTSAVEKKPKQK